MKIPLPFHNFKPINWLFAALSVFTLCPTSAHADNLTVNYGLEQDVAPTKTAVISKTLQLY